MVTMTMTTNLALRCGCVAPQSETFTAVEGTDAHGDLITETHGNCPEHGWGRVDWTKDTALAAPDQPQGDDVT